MLSARLFRFCAATGVVLAALPAIVRAQVATDPTTKSKEETLELQPFQVVSDTGNGYRVSSASVATRTNTALIDIPQTVNVVSKEFLSDIAAVTQEDAMGYVGNVFTRNNRQGPGQFIVRGFETNTALYLDGFATTQYKRDMAGYERVEVIKGPPSAVQGRGGDSGLLNFVAKKPELGRTFGEIKLMVGTEELFRGVVEGNLPLAGRDDMAARLVVVGENSGETVDDFKNRKKVFFPSFRWQITPRTDLVSFAEINFTETPATDSGAGPAFWSREIREHIPHLAKAGDIINALDIPIGTNFVGGDGSRDSFTLMSITRMTHRFSEHLQAQLGYQYINQDYYENRFTLEQNFPVVNPLGTPGVWLGPVRLNISDEQQHVNRVQGDLFSQWEFDRLWGQPKFTGMVGFEYNTIEVYNMDKQGNILAPYNYVNLAAPAEQSHITFDEVNWASVAVTTNNIRNDENKGVYLAGDVDFLRGKVILSAGGRRDFAARDTQNLRTGTSTQNTKETVTSQRYGITYKPLPRLAIYAVYSDQPDPETTQNVWGAGLPAADPRTQEQLTYKPSTELKEVGVKGELLKGRATFQVAFFEMQRVNNSLTVSTQTSFQGVNYTAVQRSLADTTIRGIELETFAAITDRLNLVANFAKNESQEFAVVSGAVVERDTHRLVDWSSNVFLKYDLRSGRGADRRGFQVRAGMRAFGPFTATLAGVRERIDRDSYRFDVGGSYQWGRSNFDLIVKNVLDEPTFIMRLDPMRQVVFTYTYRF
ncbi:TonB-dependent siderophore receptor [Oleiharenicola lentus]|uniref:TonB-dependent siderophore receptor n=1 Tax=Oleiharenicola lentus TaxID=2508720 RepID=UPI003F67C7FE